MYVDFPEPLDLELCAIPIDVDETGWDMDFMRHLLHENSRILLPHVQSVLGSLYSNNPLFSGALDRESLAQIVDRIYALVPAPSPAKNSDSDYADALLLRPLINALVLLSLAVNYSKLH